MRQLCVTIQPKLTEGTNFWGCDSACAGATSQKTVRTATATAAREHVVNSRPIHVACEREPELHCGSLAHETFTSC
jgi:hypothetical protein